MMFNSHPFIIPCFSVTISVSSVLPSSSLYPNSDLAWLMPAANASISAAVV